MALEESPEMPAQDHPVWLSPASLHNLSIWAYLALGFVILSTIGVLCYAAFSFYHSLTLNDIAPLPQYFDKSRLRTKRTKKKAWRPSKSSSSQQQPMLSPDSMEHDSTYQFDRRMSLHPPEHATDHGLIPPVTFPSAAVSPPLKPRTIPTYDMHNIRFASPSNVTIYNNPKLAPVVGSAVPLSYDSHNNLFANPFTPTTSRQVGTGQTHTASFSAAFRGKAKSTSRVFAKENLNVAGQGEMVPLKHLY
ncbi:hypothetical protein B0H17DRAFT_1211731 [Mycena rosella]|uniref:Uncharacterized protein n=1 Tax=Mycena rosella TaxID=1033263 RepID=A0AAD7CUL7_MYCRO|nr:hypothetical protein B0H17DRAFT_1211731 [Mycena rosella]